MAEPILVNDSGSRASLLPILDRDGASARLVLVKASYAIGLDGSLELAPEQREMRMGDEMWGPPEVPDIRFPADYGLPKCGTDFIVSGHAQPGVHGAPVEVGIRVADRTKMLRVHGPRQWRRSLTGVVPGASAALREPTPLAWSLAWGGIDLTDPERPLEDARNPIGRGIARHEKALLETPAPCIEWLETPIADAGGRYVPAGCAPLGRSFEPRRAAAGTYDSAWIRSGYPARPADYREAHENCGAPGLVFEQPMRGGERVRLTGVHARGALDFLLPKLRVLVEAEIDGAVDARRPVLDTVLVDGDAAVLELVWRTVYRCPPKMNGAFAAVRVRIKEFVS